jgi:uncharacterized protein (TIGR03086 family)
MTAWPEATGVAAGTELLERAIGWTRGSLALVRPDLLWRPTPCAEWDLARLLAHMDDSMAALAEGAALGRVGLPADLADASLPGEGPCPVSGEAGCVAVVRALRDQARRLLGWWSVLPTGARVVVGGHALPAEVVALTGALEVAVHGWDVAAACGSPRVLPEALAADLLAAAPLLLDDADRPGRFGPALAVAPDASAGTRLLALTGRADRA